VREALDESATLIETDLAQFPESQAAVHKALGSAYLGLKLFEQAEAQFMLAQDIMRQQLPTGDPRLTDLLDSLATAYYYQSRIPEAIEATRDAHEQRLAGAPDDPEGGTTLNNLGHLLRFEWRYEEAEEALLASIAYWERLGLQKDPGHGYLVAFDNLANLYEDAGKFRQAKAQKERSIALRVKDLGPDNLWTVGAKLSYARILIQLGMLAEADSVCAAMKGYVESGSMGRMQVLHEVLVARIRFDEGQLAAAEQGFRRALATRASQLGADSPRLGGLKFALAEVLAWSGEVEEAVSLGRVAVSAAESVRDSSHSYVAARYGQMGEILVLTGNAVEAELLLRRCLATFDENEVADLWQGIEARYWLYRSLVAQQRLDEARSELRVFRDNVGRLPVGRSRRCLATLGTDSD